MGTKIGAKMDHLAEADVMSKFSKATKTMMPKTVTCGGKAKDFKNSAPAMAMRAPKLDAPKAYMNWAAKK